MPLPKCRGGKWCRCGQRVWARGRGRRHNISRRPDVTASGGGRGAPRREALATRAGDSEQEPADQRGAGRDAEQQPGGGPLLVPVHVRERGRVGDARVGETVRLRFSVPDVTHGVAIGPGLGIDLGHVDPGQVKELRVTFDRPGRYTFYCNTWCSPSHWRMRGTILVYDPAFPDAVIPAAAPDPTVESLVARRVDIDAAHDAPAVPAEPVQVARGAEIVERRGASLPPELAESGWRVQHSPAEAWRRLVEHGLPADRAWDVVAHLWVGRLDRARWETAAALFAKNCAACHGETGNGRGPGAEALAAQGIGQHGAMRTAARPADFTRARSMLGGTSERYYAKLRRGGMGTGMPSWGPILTPDETWMLVDYLWTFVFRSERASGP